MIQTLTELRLQVFERSVLARILRRRLDAKFTQADVEKVLRELRTARFFRDRLSRDLLRERDPEQRIQILFGRVVRDRLRERLTPEQWRRLLDLVMSGVLDALWRLWNELLDTTAFDRIRWPWGAVIDEEPFPEIGMDWMYEDPTLDPKEVEEILSDFLDFMDDIGEVAAEGIPESPMEIIPEPAPIEFREPRRVTEAVAPAPPRAKRWEVLDMGQAVGVGIQMPANGEAAYVSPPFSGPVLIEHVEVVHQGDNEAYFAIRVVDGGIDPATAASLAPVSGYGLAYTASNFLPGGYDLDLFPYVRGFDWFPGLLLGEGSYRLYLRGRNLGAAAQRAMLVADTRVAVPVS
jgi:hypothetical protein